MQIYCDLANRTDTQEAGRASIHKFRPIKILPLTLNSFTHMPNSFDDFNFKIRNIKIQYII